MPAIRGVDAKLYYNSGTFAAPVWNEWQCVRSTTLSLTFDSVDASCRGSGGWKLNAPTLSNLEISGDALIDKDDASYLALRLAAYNKTVVDFLVMDGPRASATSDGFRFAGQFSDFSTEQPYDDLQSASFTIQPARSADQPNPVAVTGPL